MDFPLENFNPAEEQKVSAGEFLLGQVSKIDRRAEEPLFTLERKWLSAGLRNYAVTRYVSPGGKPDAGGIKRIWLGTAG